MSKTNMYIKRYGLKFIKTKKVNLTELHCQYRPELDNDRSLISSPHMELATLYYINGLKWLEKNFNTTKYSSFQNVIMLKPSYVPMKKIRLFDSLRGGYLKKGYKNDYIVILEEPLINTRYGMSIDLSTPEIFMGHHRAAALLALGIANVDVIIAKDNQKNKKTIYGNLHNIYKDVKWNS